MIKPEDVTIIIPHLGIDSQQCYSRSECFKSLMETIPDGMRLLIVKNGGKDCECPYMIKINDQGQCKAVNAAATTVSTPWIFVTNDDMVYPPGWFKKLVMGAKEHMLCISPKLVEPRPGAPTFLVEFCGGVGGDFDKQKFLEFVKNALHTNDSVYFLKPGFNLPFLIKKELWDTIGGYDINFDPWGSNGDSDLEYKIRLAGIQPYQQQHCLVYHFSQTSGTFHPDNQSYWQKNWDYFISKWGFPRTDEGIWEANFEMPDKERIFRPEWEGKYGPVY